MVTAQALRTGEGSEVFFSYCLLAVTLGLCRLPLPQLQKRGTVSSTGRYGSGMALQTVNPIPRFIN